MNTDLDQRVHWTVSPEGISLLLEGVRRLIPHDAVLHRWELARGWWEDGLDRRYYRVQLPDGRIGDFYENTAGQFLERFRNNGSEAGR